MSDYDATEAAVELAEEHGIDLSEVEGTGVDGRITKPDVEALLDEGELDEGDGDAGEPPYAASAAGRAREERTLAVRGSADALGPKTWEGPAR